MAVSNEINESKTLLHRVFDSYHNPEENGPFKIGVNNLLTKYGTNEIHSIGTQHDAHEFLNYFKKQPVYN